MTLLSNFDPVVLVIFTIKVVTTAATTENPNVKASPKIVNIGPTPPIQSTAGPEPAFDNTRAIADADSSGWCTVFEHRCNYTRERGKDGVDQVGR